MTYLPKSTQELIAHCRALLRRHHLDRLPKPMVLQFEELTLTPRASRLSEGKKCICRPRVLPAGTVYETLVGFGHGCLSKSGDLILRAFLKCRRTHSLAEGETRELHPRQPKYIVTVPRVGYRFG